ncbi:hypothetical protein K439DRAFT_1658121 [Ramaria rubella]|nr:hypothetical protein K439DRAFT_1658121 [Ramaria rubella]
MLDSSPLPISPPKKLKRTASVASLPSPPPSVAPVKKRATAQKFDSDNDSGSDEEVEEDHKGFNVVGRKLLFPPGPSKLPAVNDLDNPFLDLHKPSNVREQLALGAASSPSVVHTGALVVPASPPLSRRKTFKLNIPPPRTTPPVNKRGTCSASELPVLDEGDNPFLADSPPKPRRARSPRELEEQPTLTYVFKGIKTILPNPNYNLPEAARERSRLPLAHPDYSPASLRTSRRLFPEAYPIEGDDAEEVDAMNAARSNPDVELQTPDMKPRMSKLFVDAAGNPLPDSGPQGIRGKTLDASDIGRMAMGPLRGRG